MVNFLLKHGANVNAKTKVMFFSLLAFAHCSEPGNHALEIHPIGAFSVDNCYYCLFLISDLVYTSVILVSCQPSK